jgi:hypothetical protein
MYKPVEREAQLLRRYNPTNVLSLISAFSIMRQKDEKRLEYLLNKEKLNYKVAFRDFQLAFVVKLVVHFYDKPRLSTRKLTWQDLLIASRSLIKHQSPNEYPIKSLDDLDRFMIRTAYQQFPDFYGDRDTLARTHFLFRTCAHKVERKSRFSIDKAYIEATGLTLDASWEITLAIYGFLLNNKNGFISAPLVLGDLKKKISQDEVDKYINITSLSYKAYKEKMTLPIYKIDPFETYNPNPLVQWPIIEIENKNWIVPILPYLLRRGTEQVFYDVIASKGREFSGFFGYVFEEYVDTMLSSIGSKYEIIHERSYSYKGNNINSCDRIVIFNGDAVLVELKTKRLNLKTKFSADEDLLRNDLTDIDKVDDTGNVVHAIRQLHKTEQSIRANCAGLEDLNKKITGKMYPIVITLDPYYCANGGYIQRIIKEELGKGEYTVSGYDWQLVDARGLEMLCALSQREDFMGIVKEKFSTPEKAIQDMTTFIEYENVGGVTKARNIPDNPLFFKELDKFQENVQTRYSTNI